MVEEFKKYVDDYDYSEVKIRLKYEHSIRVMELANKYAKLLKMSEEDIKLASTIGLLHDIGRFEQVKRYDTFCDYLSIDHADFGADLLFKDNLISRFDVREKDYDVIEKAIRNHNKYKVESGLNEYEMMHANLIRDVDKLDILYMAAYLDYIDITTTDEDVSSEVLEYIRNNKIVKNEVKKNNNDKMAAFFAFAFDINNDLCLEEVKKHIDVLYNKFEHKEKLEEVYNLVSSYISNRLK